MIARKSMVALAQNGISALLGWFALFIIARLWGGFSDDALGIIAVAMGLMGIFGFVGDLGFNTAHIKRVSEGKDLGECLGTYILIKSILMTLIIVLTLGSIYIWKEVLGRTFYDATTESVVYVFLLYTVLQTILAIPTTTFIARTEMAKNQLPLLADIIFRALATVVVIVAGATGIAAINPDLQNIAPAVQWPPLLEPLGAFLAAHAVGSLAMTYVVGISANLLTALYFFRKFPVSRPSWDYFKSYAAFALPVLLVSGLTVLSSNVDRVMLGWFWESEIAGHYFAAQRIMMLMLVAPTAVGMLLFPTYSQHHSRNDYAKIRELNSTSVRYLAMFAFPLSIVVLLFPSQIMNIALSGTFEPAALTLAIFALYALVLALSMSYPNLLSGINRPDIGARIGVIVCVANIALNYLFIPEYGLLAPFGISGAAGAATATLLSATTGLGFFIYFAHKLAGTNIVEKSVIVQFIAISITAAILYAISVFGFGIGRWYALVAYGALCIGIYMAILYIFKEFTKKDWDFFMNTINPRELIKYVAGELRGGHK